MHSVDWVLPSLDSIPRWLVDEVLRVFVCFFSSEPMNRVHKSELIARARQNLVTDEEPVGLEKVFKRVETHSNSPLATSDVLVLGANSHSLEYDVAIGAL